MTSRTRAHEVFARILTLLLVVTVIAPAVAQETISYTYDARGRVVNVNHGTTGPNANVVSSYTYDGADNRCDQIIKTDGTTATGACPRTVAITLSPTSLPNGAVGTLYNRTITASGGTSPYTYAVTSGALPTSVTLTSTGVLSGTPSAAGTYSFTIKATDSANNTGSQAYTITISVITLSPTSLPNGTVGTAYSATITASGGTSPYTFSVLSGTLPTSVTLTPGGSLSGTPSVAGAYSFTIKATDSASHTGTQAYSVTIGSGATCSGVSFSVGNAAANEGSNLSFTVTKSGTTSASCNVSYATADNTARAGTNYTTKSGSLNFAPTDTSFPVSVATLDDGVVTGDLTMYLNLSNPSNGATITTGQGTGTIHNIDTSGNQPPTPMNDTGTQATCSTVDYNVLANDTDPDGNYPLSLVGVTGNGFSVVSGEVEFTSTLSTGAKVGTYTVQDSLGAQATATLTVTVTSGGTCMGPPPAPGG